jgi:hypothetical protein
MKGRQDMNIGFESEEFGRYIVDIDGCLRATNSQFITVAEIIALHGRLNGEADLIWMNNGEEVPLRQSDRIELSEENVAFFRSCAGPRLFRICAMQAGLAPRWDGTRPSSLTALAA